MWRLLVLGAALALASAATFAGAPRAAAAPATVVESGWWTSQPGAAPVPGGGFQVANGIDGPQSVAALRLRKDAGSGPVTLVLTPSTSSVNQDAAAKLRACPVRGDWSPANPGPASAAPSFDCTTSIPIAKDAAGTWSADVSALLAGAAEGQPVSLMVLPVGTELFAGLQLPFQITFQGASVPEPAGAPPPVPATSGGSSGAFVPPAVVPSRPVFGTPVASRPTTAAPATGATAPATPTNAAAPASPPAIRLTAGGGGNGKPWGRLVFLVPLSALGGLAVALARHTLRERGVLPEVT